MKTPKLPFKKTFLLLSLPALLQADPLIDSWHTADSGRYARIWATQAQETTERGGDAVSSLTTWDSANYSGVTVGVQPLPVYAGVQGISYSVNYVYIKSTGLATNTMGPWFLNAAQTTAFPSFPGNAAILYRFPRSTNYPANYTAATRTNTNIGTCGLFVDGVPLFNTSDTFSYDTSAGADQEPTNSNRGDGYWNRNAFINEGVTFDAGNTHQAMEQFHYHASPAALRSTLGDSVDYDSTVVYQGVGKASPYTENFNGHHSPIIAWVNDGLPMYGPYGYSDPTDPTSPIRRMVSGYQMRDGSNGSTNLASTGRHTLPKWQVDQGIRTTTTIAASLYGPNVSTTFVLGHYMEDYDYKADRISERTGAAFVQYNSAAARGQFDPAKHFDLNQYNVRYCVTTEFPEGTWAYFTAIEDDGTPAYPYNLAYKYFGTPTLASGVTSIAEPVTTVFEGAAAKEPTLESASIDNTVTVVWNLTEGGSYQISSSDDLDSFTEGPEFTATTQRMKVNEGTSSRKFYQIEQIGLATYDTTAFSTSAGGGGGGGPGDPGTGGGGGTAGTGSAAAGFVFSFANGPPFANLITNVKVGSVTGTVVSYSLAGATAGTITISFNDSSFSSGSSYQATFNHTPPGAGTVTATSTNSYTKP
jgi:hypothetical protein